MLHLMLETAYESVLRFGPVLGSPAAFFGAGLALLLGLGEFARLNRTRLHRILALFFILLGGVQFLHGLHYSGLLSALPFLYWWDLPLLYVLGPLAYWTAGLALDPEYRVRFVPAHAAPVLLALALLTPYFLETQSVKALLYKQGLVFNNEEAPLLLVIALGAALSLSFYFVLIVRQFMELRNGGLSARDRRLTFIFAACAMLLVAFGALGRLVDARFMAYGSFEITLMLCIMYVVDRRHPEFSGRLQKAYQGIRYQKTRLSGVSLDGLQARLRALMETECLYRRDDLTLADVARALEITPHQLSEFLNHRLEKSFSSLVNEYRVGEARRMLVREPRRTVLSIAYEVGFNNRASFNAAFLKFTGKTPVEYRREAARTGVAAS